MSRGYEQLTKLFEEYKKISIHEGGDETLDAVQSPGVVKFAHDIEVDVEDVILLYLMFKLKCTTQFTITRKEFIDGFKNLNCKELKDIKNYVKSLRTDYAKHTRTYSDEFVDFYNFVFTYMKEPSQRSMDNQTAAAVWKLLLDKTYKHIDLWTRFVADEFKKPISKDTWQQFIMFVKTIDTSFKDFEEDGAWPTIIDDFVAYAKKHL